MEEITVLNVDKDIIYESLKKIGSGGFGVVYEATNSVSKEKVALKVISRSNITADNLQSIRNEIDILFSLECSHENILCYYDKFTDKHNLYIVTKLIQNPIDLNHLNLSELEPKLVINIMYQIAIGCKYLSDHGVVHLDLKPSNIVICKDNFKPVIIDFGLSCFMGGSKNINCENVKNIRGTPNFISPELLLGINVDINTDIYSLGLIFYYMISKSKRRTRSELITIITGFHVDSKILYKFVMNKSSHRILVDKMASNIKDIYKSLTEIVLLMTSFNKEDRPSYDEILKALT